MVVLPPSIMVGDAPMSSMPNGGVTIQQSLEDVVLAEILGIMS
jgi:hypothetical protein